jgi:ABC-type phosphate/phosphonate transport system permease subunit
MTGNKLSTIIYYAVRTALNVLRSIEPLIMAILFVVWVGIGFLLQQWINLLNYNEAGTALLAIAIVVITLDTLSSKIHAYLQ